MSESGHGSIDPNAFVEALRAQRNDHADAAAVLRARLTTAEARVRALEAELAELKEPAPEAAGSPDSVAKRKTKETRG